MNSLLTDLSAPQLRRAALLKDEIDKLQNELGRLLGSPRLENPRASGVARGRVGASRNRRSMSPAARAKIAAAAKARWKKAKAAGKNSL